MCSHVYNDTTNFGVRGFIKKKKKKKFDANKKIHSLYIMGYKILKKRNLFLGEAILNKKREKTTKY